MIFLIIGVIWYVTVCAILDIINFINQKKQNQNNEKKRIN